MWDFIKQIIVNQITRPKGEIVMIQIIAGQKGEGKTKRLIEMANESGKTANGHTVFIDDDNKHMYDLHYNIRFVNTDFLIEDEKVFYGYICGIISQDNDIEHIYIDVLNHIVKDMDSVRMDNFIKRIEKLSVDSNIDFTMIISVKADLLPVSAQKYVV